MLTHPTLDLLHQLGFNGMAKAFGEIESSGEAAALTHRRVQASGLDAELRRRSIPGWPILPQPGGRSIALHRRNSMVDQALHEHAASLPTAGHANRSRRLIKCAKESGRYPVFSLPSGSDR